MSVQRLLHAKKRLVELLEKADDRSRKAIGRELIELSKVKVTPRSIKESNFGVFIKRFSRQLKADNATLAKHCLKQFRLQVRTQLRLQKTPKPTRTLAHSVSTHAHQQTVGVVDSRSSSSSSSSSLGDSGLVLSPDAVFRMHSRENGNDNPLVYGPQTVTIRDIFPKLARFQANVGSNEETKKFDPNDNDNCLLGAPPTMINDTEPSQIHAHSLIHAQKHTHPRTHVLSQADREFQRMSVSMSLDEHARTETPRIGGFNSDECSRPLDGDTAGDVTSDRENGDTECERCLQSDTSASTGVLGLISLREGHSSDTLRRHLQKWSAGEVDVLCSKTCGNSGGGGVEYHVENTHVHIPSLQRTLCTALQQVFTRSAFLKIVHAQAVEMFPSLYLSESPYKGVVCSSESSVSLNRAYELAVFHVLQRSNVPKWTVLPLPEHLLVMVLHNVSPSALRVLECINVVRRELTTPLKCKCRANNVPNTSGLPTSLVHLQAQTPELKNEIAVENGSIFHNGSCSAHYHPSSFSDVLWKVVLLRPNSQFNRGMGSVFDKKSTITYRQWYLSQESKMLEPFVRDLQRSIDRRNKVSQFRPAGRKTRVLSVKERKTLALRMRSTDILPGTKTRTVAGRSKTGVGGKRGRDSGKLPLGVVSGGTRGGDIVTRTAIRLHSEDLSRRKRRNVQQNASYISRRERINRMFAKKKQPRTPTMRFPK